MTFHQLIKKTLETYPSLTKFDLLQIIFFLSKNVKDQQLLHLKMQTPIDFKMKHFQKIIKKYLQEEIPLGYLIKKVFFCDLEYYVCQKTFLPRIETEHLVLEIIKNEKDLNSKVILDLCSGSGCIANTIQLHFPEARVIGIEKALIPYFVSKRNQKQYRLKTQFLRKDLFKWIKTNQEQYDLVICNPPYISFNEQLPKSVVHEPPLALYAIHNGLYFYEVIISYINQILKINGLLIFEIGSNQKESLIQILKNYNITKYQFVKDQFGRWRNLYLWRE
ncbi:MAG: peptide chain release factor N(5)-glutamine methyltransferase [Mycoplasmoidaceae bacterium]